MSKQKRTALKLGYWKELNRYFRTKGFNYPKRARLAGLEGKVYILVEVDKQGRVIKATIGRSSGHKILDDAALASVLAAEGLPPLPLELGRKSRKFKIPFEYRLSS